MPEDHTPHPPPPTAPPERRSVRRPLAWVAVGALALGVAGGGAAAVALAGDGDPERLAVATAGEGDDGTSSAAAAEVGGEHPGRGEHRRPGAHGTVTGVDGTTVTVEDEEGTATTVTTDEETTVVDVAEGELSDLSEGDTVVAMGPRGEADAEGVTAVHIVDLGSLDPEALHPGGPGPHGARSDDPDTEEDESAGPDDGERPARAHGPTVGTVAAVDGDRVTVTTEDGEVVVTTTEETAVAVVTEIAVADLAEGDTVAARGEVDDEGVVAAEVVIRGELEGGRPGMGAGFGPGRHGGPGPGGHGPGGWGPHADGERPGADGQRPGAPANPDAPGDEGATTTTEA